MVFQKCLWIYQRLPETPLHLSWHPCQLQGGCVGVSEWQDLGWDWERNTIPTKELGSGLTHSGLTCKSRGISSRLQYTARQFYCRYSILSFLTCLCSKRGGKEDLGSCNRACTCVAATELQQRGLGSVSYNRAGTELQQSCNRAATAAIELQHLQQLV